MLSDFANVAGILFCSVFSYLKNIFPFFGILF